jgi:hypothetical protein
MAEESKAEESKAKKAKKAKKPKKPKKPAPTQNQLLRYWKKCGKYRHWRARAKPERKGFYEEMCAKYVEGGFPAPTEDELRKAMTKLEKVLKEMERKVPNQPTADTDLSLLCDELGL